MSENIDNALAKIGTDYRMLISYGSHGKDRDIISITKRQYIFLRTFLNSGNFEIACQVAEVEQKRASGWFKNPKFICFLKERIQEKANANGVTYEWWISRMKDIFEGKVEARQYQLEAGRIIGNACEFTKENRTYVREFNNTELVFITQKSNNPGALPPQESRNGGLIEGEISLPDGGPPVGQNSIADLPNAQEVPKTEVSGLVRRPSSETGQGYSVGASP